LSNSSLIWNFHTGKQILEDDTMKLSAQVGNDNVAWKTLKEIALAADKGRWHTLWNYDHILPPFAELAPHITDDLDAFQAGDVFEGWSLLSAWAAITQRVRLGCLVTAIPFRNPALLAKMAATIDHISEGRLELGLGAAWHVGETKAYGIPLGGNKEKLDRFEEALEVIRLLLIPGQHSNFSGQYYQLDNAPFAPQPVQKHLPILIGGGGEKRTLALVAKYADNYNYFGNMLGGPDVYAHKNRVLDEHCKAIGRDPKEIKRSVGLFADIVRDEKAAQARRDFMGSDEASRDSLLFGSPQRILDGVGKVLDALKGHVEVDEVIFCGMTPTAETFHSFDEEILKHLVSTPVHR
jgi:F420-dependent oxidoreductase-like protein